MNSFFSLKPEEVISFPRETARYLGYPYGVSPENSVLEMIETMTAELQKVLRPKVVYEEFDCDVSSCDAEKAIVHIADFSIASNDLAKNLRGCGKVIMFAATIGRDVDLMIQKYQKLDAVKAGVLQAAGAMLTESLVDSFNEKIKTDAADSGRKAHPRYSPGYGDVSLEVQKLFFKYLDCGKIGLTLMDTLVMAPEKSVTAFIGIEED